MADSVLLVYGPPLLRRISNNQVFQKFSGNFFVRTETTHQVRLHLTDNVTENGIGIGIVGSEYINSKTWHGYEIY